MSDTANVNLNESEYVKELLEILKANGLSKDAQGLSEVVGYVEAMHRDISKAIGDVAAMRNELSVMRDERSHPIRTALQKAADGLLSKLNAILKNLASLKEMIIGACKQTVEAFKDQGIIALNDAVMILDIKQDLKNARGSIDEAVKYNNGQIAKIEAASAEMHAAGRSVRNIVRAFQGKDPIQEIKPNGRLAKFVETPFRLQIRSLNRSLGRVDKALAQIDKLEKAAAQRAERGRPSTLKDIREKQAQNAGRERKAPDKNKDKSKSAEAAI